MGTPNALAEKCKVAMLVPTPAAACYSLALALSVLDRRPYDGALGLSTIGSDEAQWEQHAGYPGIHSRPKTPPNVAEF